jgi:cytochrome c
MWPRYSLGLLAGLFLAAGVRAEPLGIGTPASRDQIEAEDIDIRPDGAGLPPGHGSVAEGAAVFAAHCAACHAAEADGKAPAPALVGGQGTLTSAKPLKTVGSYWPYATTLFDYTRRAMPFNAPESLSNEQVYAVTAYVLHLNGILPADAVLDAHSLPLVRMPNRDGFRSVWPN